MAINESVIAEILRLYDSNNSITSIKQLVGVSQPTISKIIKRSGRQIRKHNYQKLHLNKDEIRQLYESGASTYAIANKFKCSDETIRKMVTVRPAKIRNKLNAEAVEKIRKKSISNWQDDQYVAKVRLGTNTPQYKASLSKAGQINYVSSLGKWIKSAHSRNIISESIKRKWLEDDYRAKQQIWFSERGKRLSEAAQKYLSVPTNRRKWLDKLRHNSSKRRLNSGWVSTSQKQLYYILSISGIEYHEEGADTMVGPYYVVDCVIPQQQSMLRPLIIEVQGEYWHQLPHVALKDRQKATYVRNHTNYDLLYIDELEMSSFTQVATKLATYGLSVSKITATTTDLEIKQISENDASLFYSIFHYTGKIRKGAITFGAFYNGELKAAISYTYPIRLESATSLKLQMKEVLEISRLARCTNFECKNLISFLIGRSKRLLPKQIKAIVSYSDATYGHTGKVYAASGFTQHSSVAPDYFYISMHGKYHKKTIWDRSKRMKMTETDYADKHGLMKMPSAAKTKWVLRLRK